MLRCLLAIFLVLIPQICFARKSRTLDLILQGISDLSSVQIPKRIRRLLLGSNNISSLEGLQLPTKIREISLLENDLNSLQGLESDSLKILILSLNPNLRDYTNLVKLPNLEELFVGGNLLDENNFDFKNVPNTVRNLSLTLNTFTQVNLKDFSNIRTLSIDGMFDGFEEDLLDYSKVFLPEGLEVLFIGSRDHPDIFTDLVIPDSVTEIVVSDSFITTDELKTLKFPPNLRKLRIKRNSIETLDGIEFPKSLRVLNLQIGPMTKEERQKARAKLGKRVRIIFKCGRKCQFRP